MATMNARQFPVVVPVGLSILSIEAWLCGLVKGSGKGVCYRGLMLRPKNIESMLATEL